MQGQVHEIYRKVEERVIKPGTALRFEMLQFNVAQN